MSFIYIWRAGGRASPLSAYISLEKTAVFTAKLSFCARTESQRTEKAFGSICWCGDSYLEMASIERWFYRTTWIKFIWDIFRPKMTEPNTIRTPFLWLRLCKSWTYKCKKPKLLLVKLNTTVTLAPPSPPPGQYPLEHYLILIEFVWNIFSLLRPFKILSYICKNQSFVTQALASTRVDSKTFYLLTENIAFLFWAIL